jgi:uncharacterized protein (DUF2237 family)
MSSKQQLNIFGQPLELCSSQPITGYTRNGVCEFVEQDAGLHSVCAILTPEFLRFTRSKGNSLKGLKVGQHWCLCINRWIEALHAGVAPPIIGKSTNIHVLNFIPKNVIKPYVI